MCICLWTEQIFFEGWLEKIVNEEFVSKNSVRHSQQLCLVNKHYASLQTPDFVDKSFYSTTEQTMNEIQCSLFQRKTWNYAISQLSN